MSPSLISLRKFLPLLSNSRTFSLWNSAMAVALLFMAQSSFAQYAGAGGALSADFMARYPAGSILTATAASLALSEALTVREQIESQFILEEQACYPTFFASSCLDSAQEHRREALARVRPVEDEANTFNRRMRVLDRDKALEEKRAVLAAEAPLRAKDQQLKEAEKARKISDSAQKTQALQDAGNMTEPDVRVEEHAQNLRRLQAAEAANAPKRAANEATFVQKSKDAKKRQYEVAANRMEKERARIIQVRELAVGAREDAQRSSAASAGSSE